MSVVPPSEAILDAILGPQTTINRRVDIYEEDATTLYMENAPLIDGQVSIDMDRSERRTMDLKLDNTDGRFIHTPGEFWYDKIIKIYRGATAYDPVTGEEVHWETPLGEFMIDSIVSRHFPNEISVTGRDYTKKLLLSKFRYATSFPSGTSVLTLIETIARNGGITKFSMPTTIDWDIDEDDNSPDPGNTQQEYSFETDDERWSAISEIALAFGLEVYFDQYGYMVVREFQDPISAPISYTFETGENGVLVNWEKNASDARMHNVVVVMGESSETVPVSYAAENNEPGSPTSISEIGERVYVISSPYIRSEWQARNMANNLLSVHALEEFTISFESIVMPWLGVGEIIKFVVPDQPETSPTLFLLTSLAIPLGLGSMSSVGKRVTVVG